MKKLLLIGGALCALLLAGPLQAATITHPLSVGLQSTNWDKPLILPRFNPAIGVLTQVTIDLDADLEGTISVENLDFSTGLVNVTLAADVKLANPLGGYFCVTAPSVSQSETLAAFDGMMDFAGTSGRVYSGLSGSDSDSYSTTAPADLSYFTGATPITLSATAKAASSATGPGNIIVMANTSAGADVLVTYHYDVIPEPATVGLLGLGSLFLRRWRRRV